MTQKLKCFLRTITAITCSLALLCTTTPYGRYDIPIEAKTIAELEQEKQENSAKISELEKKIAEYEEKKQDNDDYQQALQEQVDALNGNIRILDAELQNLNSEIEEKNQEISDLSIKIEQQQESIDKNLEEFKLRIRAMYINGNDSYASILLGSMDFYDMLTRMDLIGQIAEHDDALVNTLKNQLVEMQDMENELLNAKSTLELKVTEANLKRDEFTADIESLNITMEKTQSEKERLELEKKALAVDVEELQNLNAQLKAEEDEMIEAARIAEEAEKKRQEEERKKQEEEEKKRKEEEEKRRQEEEKKRQEALNATEPATQTTDSGYATTTAPYSASTTTTSTVTTVVTTAPQYYSSGSMIWPVPGFNYISSYYGARWGSTHQGIDIAGSGIHGSAAVAAMGGTVSLVKTGCSHDYPKSGSCGCNGGFGNYVQITHGNGLSTTYAHLTSVAVSVGTYVSAGTVIGYVGSTGWSTGYHLHFGVTLNGSYVNPCTYLGR